MSKDAVETIIKQAAQDAGLYRKLAGARTANEALAHFDLTAEERNAILNRDHAALQRMGVAQTLLRVADWCTGE
jgi:hypothetical protein